MMDPDYRQLEAIVMLSLAGVQVLPAQGMDEPYVYVPAARKLFVDGGQSLVEVDDICQDVIPEIIANADASELDA